MLEWLLNPFSIASIILLVATIILFFYNRIFALGTAIAFFVTLFFNPSILSFISVHATLTLSFVGIAVIVSGFYTKNSKFMFAGLSLFLVGVFFDWYFPPLSHTCFAQPNYELTYISQNPESAFAIDTAVCKFYVQHFPNFVILSAPKDLKPISYYLLPVMLVAIVSLTGLAIYLRNFKFWIGSFFTIMYAALLIYLFQDVYVEDFYITTATLFGYVIFPPIIAALGFFLLPLGDKNV